ncbi:M24 family metallopeptidase [Chloroflexota bacterium]
MIRLENLRQKLDEYGVEGIITSHPANRRYLSRFTGSEGYIIVTAEQTIVATDFRYIQQAKNEAPDYEIYQIHGGINQWFTELVGSLNIQTLGFEAEHTGYQTYQRFTEAIKQSGLSLNLKPTASIVEALRQVKDTEELAQIKKAAALGDAAMNHLADWLKPGVTELEAVWEVEKYLRESGSEGVAFEIIVASGQSAAMPHAQPSIKTILEGEPIIVDLGACVNGYMSDLSRTLCLGTPDEQFKKIYNIVLGAELASIAIIEEGMTGTAADNIARRFIEETGFGNEFGHSLGHGVGLEVHEQPRLATGSKDILSEGMVFTIEPGIYLPGWGGVRIEDLVTLENGKIKILSAARKVNND